MRKKRIENDKKKSLSYSSWLNLKKIKQQKRVKEMERCGFRLIKSSNNCIMVLWNRKQPLHEWAHECLRKIILFLILDLDLLCPKKIAIPNNLLIPIFSLFFFCFYRNEAILTIFFLYVDENNKTRWIMELILSKRSQKQRKLRKQSELSRLSKLLPDDLYKTITRKSRSYR